MDMQKDDAKAMRFPLPPMCEIREEDFIQTGESVNVFCMDGREIEGEIFFFDGAREMMSVISEEERTLHEISFREIAMLSLPKGRVMNRLEVEESTAEGAFSAPKGQQEYSIDLRNGQSFGGRTFGCQSDFAGIYIFPTADGESYSIAFFPHHAIASRHIGQPVGKILVEDRKIEEEDLKEALTDQIERRDLPLGEYLRSRAICSEEELESSLDKQKRMPHLKLGEILLGEGLITEEQLAAALEDQKLNRKVLIGQILISKGLVTMQSIQEALAKKMGIPFVDLRRFPVNPEVTELVPEDLARKYRIMPLFKRQKKLVVAVENPLNYEGFDALRFKTDLYVDAALASAEDINWAIGRYYADVFLMPQFDAPMKDLVAQDGDQLVKEVSEEADDAESLSELTSMDSVLVKMVDKMILDAANQQASDIHIEPSIRDKKVLIRFRRDGSLYNYDELPHSYSRSLVSRIKIMCGMDIAERRKPQDGKINFKKQDADKIELRVVTVPTADNREDVVIRILSTGEPPSLDKLGFSARNLMTIEDLIHKPYGLFIVCGPTGSGKTTTLHSMLKRINTPHRKIWTVEDPVEITQKGLRQVQVNPKIGLDFAMAMRTFLRADPDIIMLGEMRDHETAKTGVEASLTGHLVLSTLHTNSAPESVTRMLNMGLEAYSFADALLGILAQRLAKRLCTSCKKAYRPSAAETEELLTEYCTVFAGESSRESLDEVKERILSEWKTGYAGAGGEFTLYRAVGCPACFNSGYRGRMALHELLVASPVIKSCIINQYPISEILMNGLLEGMKTLKQDGIEKILQGDTDLLQVHAVCM